MELEQTEKDKLLKLKDYFAGAESVAVAFSGGVDSTLLVKVAHDVLGNKMIAVTLVSSSFPERERKSASDFCRNQGINQIEIEYNELLIPGFAENPVDRCYICKKELFRMIKNEAEKKGIHTICEGSNADDSCVYRPGMKAIKEMEIQSPLLIAGLSKNEIRDLLKYYNISVWNKPSLSCLATRFVYGEKITKEKLEMVGKAEQLLIDLGFNQMRVRVHGTIARIELLPQDFERFMKEEIRDKVVYELKLLGFSYVTLDIQGFRSGSMDEGRNIIH